MNYIKLFIIPILLSCSQSSFATSVYDEVEENAKHIDLQRQSSLKTNKPTLVATENINDILSGRRYRIALEKHATDEERKKARFSILSMHLYKKDMGVTEEIFKDMLYRSNPAYYAHLMAIATLHIAADFAANDNSIYFLSTHQLIQEVVKRINIFSNRSELESGFRTFIKDYGNKQEFVGAVLGEEYVRHQVVPLTDKKYKDVTKPWLGEIYMDFAESEVPISKHGMPQNTYKVTLENARKNKCVKYVYVIDKDQDLLNSIKSKNLDKNDYFNMNGITIVYNSNIERFIEGNIFVSGTFFKYKDISSILDAYCPTEDDEFTDSASLKSVFEDYKQRLTAKKRVALEEQRQQKARKAAIKAAKAQWTDTFKLKDGTLLLHTPQWLNLGGGMQCRVIKMMSPSFNGMRLSPAGLIIKVGMSRQEFIDALRKAGVY